jgi:SAM-dependent MidA family methyltransferase
VTASELIRAEISREGPIPFERFMDLALYAPGCGYYTRERDPFGIHGDFYTAAQLQPVFGILMARIARSMLQRAGSRTVVELGPGRGEMAPAFSGFDYLPVDAGGSMPESFSGLVFANEFFDALPVHLIRRVRRKWREVLVTAADDGFVYAPRTRAPSPSLSGFLDRYYDAAPDGSVIEVNLGALAHVEAVSRAVESGFFLIIDYGYTAREWIRHREGTLMSYRRHLAVDDVLAEPGERDITAHVAWTPLEDALKEHNWTVESFQTLARTLADAGESDHFASVFADCGEREQLRRRMQLKTLLFGMGETFRVLVVSKGIGENALHK